MSASYRRVEETERERREERQRGRVNCLDTSGQIPLPITKSGSDFTCHQRQCKSAIRYTNEEMSAITWSTTGRQTLPRSISAQPGSFNLQPATHTHTHSRISSMHTHTHTPTRSPLIVQSTVLDWFWQEVGTELVGSIRHIVVVYSKYDNCFLCSCHNLFSHVRLSKSPETKQEQEGSENYKQGLIPVMSTK